MTTTDQTEAEAIEAAVEAGEYVAGYTFLFNSPDQTDTQTVLLDGGVCYQRFVGEEWPGFKRVTGVDERTLVDIYRENLSELTDCPCGYDHEGRYTVGRLGSLVPGPPQRRGFPTLGEDIDPMPGLEFFERYDTEDYIIAVTVDALPGYTAPITNAVRSVSLFLESGGDLEYQQRYITEDGESHETASRYVLPEVPWGYVSKQALAEAEQAKRMLHEDPLLVTITRGKQFIDNEVSK